jgi:5-hydroxyisourate hydrolase-like protein (transthyretin family)
MKQCPFKTQLLEVRGIPPLPQKQIRAKDGPPNFFRPVHRSNILAARILCGVVVFLLIAPAPTSAQTKPKPASGFTIAGTVVNAASGEPVRRAKVALLSNESRQTVDSVETDSEGRFALGGLPAGKYPLTASKRGFLTAFYDEHDGGFTSAIVTGADQNTSGLVFRLTPGASLSGVVTGDGSDPVEGASVMLFLKPHHHNPGDRIRSAGETTTDDTGAYEFDGLKTGEYLIAVKAEPWFAQHSSAVGKRQPESEASTALDVAYPVTYFDSMTDKASASPISLSGGNSEEANINLRAVPALRLTVEAPVNQYGALVSPSLQQTIFDTTLNNIRTGIPVTHNNTNEFELTGIAPGNYELTLGDPPRVVDIDVTTSQQIAPNPGSTAAILSGLLQSADGSALPENTKVFLMPLDETQNHNLIQTIVNQGKFTFDAVPPRNWELWAYKPDFPSRIISLTIGNRTLPGNQITVHDKPIQVIATVSFSETRVEGFARNRDGKGQSGAMIVLVPKEMKAFRSLARRDQSDSDGSFSLRDVVPGPYLVVAIQDGWELDWQRPEVIRRYLSGGIPVTVTESSGKLLRLTDPVPVQKP